MDGLTFLYSTAPDEKTAGEISRALVSAGAAACVNIIPGIRSVYRWDGEIEEAVECALIIKTTAAASEEARRIIRENHPYEVPAVVALPIDEPHSSSEFCAWLRHSVEITT